MDLNKLEEMQRTAAIALPVKRDEVGNIVSVDDEFKLYDEGGAVEEAGNYVIELLNSAPDLIAIIRKQEAALNANPDLVAEQVRIIDALTAAKEAAETRATKLAHLHVVQSAAAQTSAPAAPAAPVAVMGQIAAKLAVLAGQLDAGAIASRADADLVKEAARILAAPQQHAQAALSDNREAFEQFWTNPYHGDNSSIEWKEGDGYFSFLTREAYRAWQAGRADLIAKSGADIRHDKLFQVYSETLTKLGYTAIEADSNGLMAVANYAILATRQPEPVEERFYFDHGQLHDRVTGQHMWTQDQYDEQRITWYAKGKEDAELTAPVAAAVARAVPDGWQLVPKEATFEWKATLVERGYKHSTLIADVLAAAPQPPAEAAPVGAKDELVRSGLSLMVELKKVKDEHAKMLENVYSALLWLHRRLPLAYKPFAGLYATIESVGRAIGHDAKEALAEEDAVAQRAGSGEAKLVVEADEVAWMIERKADAINPPMWWNGSDAPLKFDSAWHPDPNVGIRFKTAPDATAQILRLLRRDGIKTERQISEFNERVTITEHKWIAAPPPQPDSGRDAALASMSVEQEPKYGIRNGFLYNRASGEYIPSDEPVFIFRARDSHAVNVLAGYAREVTGKHHSDAVWGRVNDFKEFWSKYPERMKAPDTAIAAMAAQGEKPVGAA